MAIPSNLLLLLLLLFSLGYAGFATEFRLQNFCRYTVWPGIFSGNGAGTLGGGGFSMAPGSTVNLTVPPRWSGRVWARTGCSFGASGDGKCVTGDCGFLKCALPGKPPATLVEFTTGSGSNPMDFYDVSLVDGYNVGMGVQPIGGAGDCKYAGCFADLNGKCPSELQVVDSGSVVACKSACAAFKSPEFCCSGSFSTPETCSATQYSKRFKQACPTAYSYAYDDKTSTRTCTGSDYLITFCPSGSQLY